MAKTIIGIILLVSPFLLIHRFKDKRLGFAYLLSFLFVSHLSIAIITQAFHIFTYPVVITVHAIIFLIVLIKSNLVGSRPFLRNFSSVKKIDGVLILILIIVFICLFSVHYNYSGKYSVINPSQYKQAENMRYPYPYYSDEWYAVTFIKHSINTHSLPFKNPLTYHRLAFVNLEFAFHSFLSELVLLLNLNPLTDYSLLAIFFGLMICVLIYNFLRYSSVGKLPAAIACLSALYITNGANLPGIWMLLPLIPGILSMLLSFFFVASDDKKMIFFMVIITLLFYPPLFPFCAVGALSFFLTSKKLSLKEKVKNIFRYLASIMLAGLLLLLAYFLSGGSANNLFSYIARSKIFYPTFIKNSIPQFLIWYVVPIPVLILSILDIFSAGKKRLWMVSMLFLGIAYWIMYSSATFRFIIEYQRVVVFTSILMTITAGFGLNWLIGTLKKSSLFQRNSILSYIQAVALILFLFFSFGYTKRDNWQKLTLLDLKTGRSVQPAAPANRYLHPDDLRIFRDIKNQVFLSFPWKGTVIGIATDNCPITTKSGTVSINEDLFYEFMNSDNNKKYEIAKSYYISYVYVPRFDCPDFEFIAESEEGICLYKFIPKINHI